MSSAITYGPNTAPKIESTDLTVANLLKNFYTVPDFQREYVWQPENVEQLLQDVYDEFFDEEGKLLPTSEYFIGSIVACPDESDTFQLIDGQQRMTTLYLVLCAVRDCLQEAGAEVPGMLSEQIRDERMDPMTFDTLFDYRLVLQYEDSHGVLQRIADEDVPVSQIPATTTSVQNMLAAYKAVREFLSVNFQNEPKRVWQFYGAFTQRVKLIRIVTPSLAHALKVFETINDRGVGLNAMDLLKNLLFIHTSPEDYAILKDRWKRLTDILDSCNEKPLRFLRYYIMSHHEIDLSRGLREDEIYQWFVGHADEAGINSAPLKFVDQLVSRALSYAYFVQGKDPQGEPNRYLRNLQSLSGTARQHFILLLAGQHLDSDQFRELCRHIENLFFTFIITREQTKTLERIFARSSSALRSVQTNEELQQFLAKRIVPEIGERQRAFDFALSELSMDRLQQYRMRYVLAKLTQFVDEQAWGNQGHQDLQRYLDSSVHIEHILPQKPTVGVREDFDKPEVYHQYTNKLGNLTLLEKTINISVSNGPFHAKRPGYAQSMFLLTKSIAEEPKVGIDTQLNRAVQDLIKFDVWDSEAIELRQTLLGDLARRIWLQDAIDIGEVQET